MFGRFRWNLKMYVEGHLYVNSRGSEAYSKGYWSPQNFNDSGKA